jgi:hypothetical protein
MQQSISVFVGLILVQACMVNGTIRSCAIDTDPSGCSFMKPEFCEQEEYKQLW